MNPICFDVFHQWGYSWHHWAYKLYGAWTWDSHGLFNLGDDNDYDCPTIESCLNPDRVRLFARTFPAAVAGTGKYFHFNDATDEAVLVYQPDPSIDQPTLLRVPVQWRYESGVQINISPAGVASWNFMAPGGDDNVSEEEANSTLEIRLTEAWNGEELSVVISPAPA